MHTQGACTGSNVYTCVREGPCSERLVGPRAHTVPTTARSPFSVLMAAHKPSGVRGVRGPCRRQRSRTQHTRQRRRREWAKSGASVGALRSRLARTAVGVHARRSLDAADAVRWSRAAGDLGFPGEKCGTPRCSPTSLLRWVERRQRQRREPRGECGVHNTRACVHIRHGESSCGPYRRREASQRPPREFETPIPDPGPRLATSHVAPALDSPSWATRL